jgi:hypothetical protein
MGYAIHLIIGGIASIVVGVLATRIPDLGWYPPIVFIAFGLILIGLGSYFVAALRRPVPVGPLTVPKPTEPSPPPQTFASSPPWVDDPRLEELLRDIGEPTAEFKPAAGNITASLIVAAALALFGVAMVGLGVYGLISPEAVALPDPKKADVPAWIKCALLILFGGGFAVMGGMWCRIKWQEFGSRILVCPGGFVNARRKKSEVFRWGDIDKVVQDYVEPEKCVEGDGPPMKGGTRAGFTFL